MKKLLIISLLLFFSISVFSQSRFEGFFEPKSGVKISLEREASHTWFFRPAAQMTAIQFTYDKELKQFEASTFQSAGIGLGYQHYVEHAGELVNNYGFNALIIFDASQSSMAGVGFALTVNALQLVNVGAGYNMTDKQIFLLTGVVWNF